MYRIGVDLGGTHIGIGIVKKDGKIIATKYTDTPEDRDFTATVRTMGDTINSLIKENGIAIDQCEAVGIGSPGIADAATGSIIYSANFSWRNTPLRTELQKFVPLPVVIANDADAAGWAEYIMGAGRGSSSCVTITLGTGVGGGIVLGGKLFSGGMAGGGELGHVTLVADGRVCGCGKKGCAEAYASATALIKRAQELLLTDQNSSLNSVKNLNAKAIVDAARNGDKLAVAIYNEYINYLAHLLASIINLLAPEVIAIGGGVAGAGDFLLEPLCRRVDELILNKALPRARITTAVMGSDAGIVGAALLEI